jgi:hypothetical protein
MAKEGVYFKNSSGDWTEIFPKTRAWLDQINPNWLNDTSVAVPKWYWVEGDELGFHQKPSTAYTLGGRVYHLKKATPMDNGDKYPWTNTTSEITAFIPLDDAIIAYAKWRLAPALGQVTEQDLTYREFIAECSKGAKKVNRRPDLMIDRGFAMRIS